MDKQICRLCYVNFGKYFIFANNIEVRRSVKIMYCCANLKLIEGDGLPSHICADCDKEVSRFYCFILKCEEADKKLRLLREIKNEQPDVEIKNEEFEKSNSHDEPDQDLNYEYASNTYIHASEDSIPMSNVQDTNLYELNNDCNLSDENTSLLDVNDTCLKEFNENHCVLDDNCPIPSVKNKYIKKSNKNHNDFGVIDRKEKTSSKSGKRKYTSRVRKSGGICVCSVCGRKCANPSTLKIHLRCHTNDKPFSCKFCDKKYKDAGGLKRHEQRNHHKNRERNFICDHCGKTFYSKAYVQIHIRSHTGETPYVCKICSQKFTQLSSKLRHERRHIGKKTESCITCNKLFYTKQDVEIHAVVHSSEKKYSCHICNSPFKYKNNLKKHILRHIEPEKFICNYCGCTFNMKGNLKMHISNQHSSKSGYCNICAKDIPNIETHVLIHSGKRPYKCEYCLKSYTTKNGLAHHINFRHKFPDKYKCQVNGCNLRFPSQPMVDFHVAKHHNHVIPFSCDRCSRGFYRKSDLSRHKLGTHKERLS